MKDFQDRRRGKRLIYSKLTIAVLLFLVLFLGKAVTALYLKSRLSTAGRDQAAARLDDLELQKNTLQSRVDWLSTSRGEEEELRRNFAVIKPGEKMITIVEEPAATTSATAAKAKKSWWSGVFFGWWPW